MKMAHAILLSQDMEFISVCKHIGQEVGIEIVSKPDLANFLLGLQENDFQIAMFDCAHIDTDILKWVKVVRKTRPKIPLIIFSDEVDQITGGKVYDEGIFFLYIRPVVENVLSNVLTAALAFHRSGIKI